MAGYFIGIHRDLRMRKELLATVSSDEFNTIVLNSKLYKVVSYIQDNKDWERIFVIFKIKSPFLWVIHIEDSNNTGMYKVFYYATMTKISIIKSSYDINNKELLPVSGSSSQNVCISSDIYTKEEENIGTDDS